MSFPRQRAGLLLSTMKVVNSPSSVFLSSNAAHCYEGIHLGPLTSSVGLGRAHMGNQSNPAGSSGFVMSNKDLFLYSGISSFLPASMK